MFVERDNEGYLLDPADWNVRLAEDIVREENIQLTEDHWSVVNFIRHYFDEKQIVPQARFALKHLKTAMDDERGNRRYLYTLFPYGYGQQDIKY